MRSFLIAVALALASSPALASDPTPAHASATAAAPGHAWVYLGHFADDGKLEGSFEGVPLGKANADELTHAWSVQWSVPHAITATEGVTLRATGSPGAQVLGRLPRRAKVQLLGVIANYGYLWGEVDISKAKVLALETGSPAHDGFTGRSGYGPSRTGPTNSPARHGFTGRSGYA